MRLAFAALLAALAAGASGQLRPAESRALDDAMTLANIRPSDLGGVMPPLNAKPSLFAALRDPIAGLVEASARHESVSGDEVSILRNALGMVGGASVRPSKGEVADLPPTVPASFRRPVGLLVAAIAAANDEIRASCVRLSASERRTLIETLPRLAVDDPSLALDYARSPPAEFARAGRLLELVDTARIEAAGFALASAVRDAMPALRAIPKGPMPRLVFRVRGVTVELAGGGADVHDRRDVGLCIDTGGDDRYVGRYGAGVGYASVLLDLGGNDRYFGPDANYGVGVVGIGLAYDLAGDDVYGVRSVGLGCGLAGLGMLLDEAGDDRYRVVGLGLGAGVRGIGLLNDRIGDDAYDVGRAGEGYGCLGGAGWCADAAGDDVYRGGEWVQGTGRDAGFGLLSDLGGNDAYRAVSGQASGIGGWGSLGDSHGNDTYVAEARAQAFASAGGYAALVEGAGNDSYLLRRGPGQAAAFAGVALLQDRAGDDVYGGTDGTPASVAGGGVSILLDGEGADRYLASAAFRRDAEGIALWADGGGHDQYGDGRNDAQAAAGMGTAVFDAFGAPDASPTATVLPTPGSLPMPSAAQFAELRRRAADGPDRPEAVARLVGIGIPALEALASSPDDLFVNVAARLGAVAAPTVARLAESKDAVAARAALATAGFVPIPSASLLAALERSDLARDAARAAGRAKERAAVPALIRLAASPDVLVVRSAMEALALIGDPQAAGTGTALVDSEDLAVRRSAFGVALLQPGVAVATGVRLAASADGFRKRIGLALLGAVGTPQAIAAIAPSLQGSREAKIGALLALDGRVPTELVPAVEALRLDPDPLVRAIAERTDVGP